MRRKGVSWWGFEQREEGAKDQPSSSDNDDENGGQRSLFVGERRDRQS
jgi:hypothetical protein